MAYLAFYRMFRPDGFDGVIRQEHIIKILKNQINGDRIGHAYLFCGPRGTGKTSIARIFARAINCQSPVNGSPCGKCASCKALLQPSNLDITEIDAASNNGVDEMRDLREKVQYPPVSCRYKVYIIDEVHMLTDSAFNALLKTLEEPPAHAVFIMATTEPHKIPATILSRCMRFDFKLIPQADLEGHLKGILKKIGKEYEDEAVSAIARAAAGSDRDMLSIADMCVSYSDGTLTYSDVTKVLGSADFYETGKLCSHILRGEYSSAVSELERIISEGKGVGVLIKDIMNFLNSCAIAKMCKNAGDILSLPSEMYKFVYDIASAADGHRILRSGEIMAKAETDLKYSASPRIILETAVLKASMPETDYNIDNLIARINELEEKLKSGAYAIKSAPAVKEEAPPAVENDIKEEAEEAPPYGDEDIPFPEEPIPVFDDAPPFMEPPAIKSERAAKPLAEEKKAESIAENIAKIPDNPQRETAAPTIADPAVKTNTFGKFMRSLRKTGNNGVLFVMCQDLTSRFEGDKFILSTENENIYRSLNRGEHIAIIKTALENIGVTNFLIEYGGKKDDGAVSLTEQIKKDFGDVKITEY